MGKGRPRGGGHEAPDASHFFRPRNQGSVPGESTVPAVDNPSQATEGAVSLSPGERALMKAIEELHKKTDNVQVIVAQFENKMDSLNSRMNNLDLKVTGLDQRLVSQEEALQELKTASGDAQSQIRTIVRDRGRFERRLERTENQLRETHLRVLGVPAFGEGVNVPDYMADLLSAILDLDVDKDPFFITKAFRLPSRRTKPGETSAGTVLVKLSDVGERDLILQRARQKKELHFKGSRIYVFPDVSPASQEKRIALLAIRRSLVDKGITAAVLYPARLKVVQGDKVFLFSDVEAAKSFVDNVRSSSEERES